MHSRPTKRLTLVKSDKISSNFSTRWMYLFTLANEWMITLKHGKSKGIEFLKQFVKGPGKPCGVLLYGKRTKEILGAAGSINWRKTTNKLPWKSAEAYSNVPEYRHDQVVWFPDHFYQAVLLIR